MITDLASHDDAIKAGREHEQAGRLTDAIDAYGDALRVVTDHRLAAHVLHLRHRAALELGTTQDVGEPRRPPDPFPGVEGVPEIRLADLDAEVLGGGILHHGALIVRGVTTEAEAAEMQAMVARAFRDRDGRPARTDSDDQSWYQEFEPQLPRTAWERSWADATGAMLTADAPTVMCSLLDLLARVGVLASITDHLGERAAVSFNKSLLRRVRQADPSWHQDGAFLGQDVRTVDLWLSLSSCGAGTSRTGLDIVPRRFDDLLPTQTHGAVFPNTIGDGLLKEVASDAPFTTPTFAPGDAVLFDGRCVHRTGIGPQYVDERQAIETWFFAASTLPDGYIPILT